MRIGYPCINRSIDCTAGRTFRLANYSHERLTEAVSANLACLQRMLEYNRDHGLLFLRISSDIIPFASHPVCTFDWRSHFAPELKSIGSFIKKHNLRVAMHPDQFVLLNALSPGIVDNSISELLYHARFLDSLNADRTAKIQIHVGGVYGDKPAAITRFLQMYDTLPQTIRHRLVIENDERLFCLDDCLAISRRCKIPVILDVFHHALYNKGESICDALRDVSKTWGKADGVPIVDYSSQAPGSRKGAHIDAIDLRDFGQFILESLQFDFDIMLEIKNKETSALKALACLADDRRMIKA